MRIAVAICMLAGPLVASADEYHYQGPPVGARAAAMGGAFAGLATDGSAAFHNPAGLVLSSGTELSLSTSVYGIARDNIDGSDAIQAPTFLAFPATFVLVKSPPWVKDKSGTPTQRYAVSILMTDFTKVARQGLTADSQELFKATDSTTYYGLSYGYRLSDRLSIGASAWLVSRSEVRFEQTSRLTGAGFELDRRDIDASQYGLQAFASALWQVTDFASAGVTLRTPMARVANSLNLTQFTKRPDSPLEEQTTDQGQYASRLPLSVVVGAAVRVHPILLFSADLSVYAPTGRYDALRTEMMVETVDKRAIVNGAVGAEVMLASSVPLRLGFYTDRSARADAIGASGLATLAPDFYVGTGSISYETERTSITAGMAYQTGTDSVGDYVLAREEIRGWIASSYRL